MDSEKEFSSYTDHDWKVFEYYYRLVDFARAIDATPVIMKFRRGTQIMLRKNEDMVDEPMNKSKLIPLPSTREQAIEILKMLESQASKRIYHEMPMTEEQRIYRESCMKVYWESHLTIPKKEVDRQKSRRSGFRGKLMTYKMRKELFGK
jgi:hypothetical protein